MLLLKELLWNIVAGIEAAPDTEDADATWQYKSRKNRALAFVTLAVEPWLLYHIDDVADPRSA